MRDGAGCEAGSYYFSTQGCSALVSGLVLGALEELAAAAACRALRSKKLAMATAIGSCWGAV